MRALMKTHLKIKIASLSAESESCRRQLRHWLSDHPMAKSIQRHRRKVVLPDLRAAHLAYGFLRGRDYRAIEDTTYFPPNWDRVSYYVRRFGNGYVDGVPLDIEREVMQTFQGWLEEARAHCGSKEWCKSQRQIQQNRGIHRKLAYKVRFWRPDPTDQAKLKAELHAKWKAREAELVHAEPDDWRKENINHA